MSRPAPPTVICDNAAKPEAYVLSLISEGKFQAALDVIADLGRAPIYWPDFYNQAQRLLLSGHLEAAAAAANAAIAVDSDRAQAYQILGEVRLRQRRWGEAEPCFRAALARDSRSAAAHFGLGRALRQQGKRRQALEALVAAIEMEPCADWRSELQRAMRRGGVRRGKAEVPDPLLRRAERALRRAAASPGNAAALPTISVCIIARDEEDSLPRCLASARRIADEIIVIDTGSRDGTVAVAERFGAKVAHFTWCDDFAAARNESLRCATCDWVLVLDADDELGDPTGLKRYLAQAEGVNVCSMRTRIPHRGQAGETVVEHPRLFRNHMGFHYRGAVHEQLCDAEGNPVRADAALDLFVYHHGYLEDEPEQKKREERNLRILHAWVARDAQDPWAQFCLGQAYYTARDMEKCIPPLLLALRDSAPDRAYRAKAYAYLASAQSALGRHQQAAETCRAGLAEFVGQPELLFCLGYALEKQGKTAEAIEAYEEATRGRFGAMLAYHDFTCRDLKPLARLAEIHAAHGRFDDAELCLARIEHIRGPLPAVNALRERINSARRLAARSQPAAQLVAEARAAAEARPHDAAARVRLAAALLGCGNEAAAEPHLDAALAIDPACPEALNLKGVILCAAGNHAAAAEHFQRAAALRPDYADALCNLGAARLCMNDIARAETAFRQAAQAEPACFAAHLALAEIASSRGNHQAAVAAYESAIRADASQATAWLGLARAHLSQGAYQAAAQCYARAAQVGGAAPHIIAEIEQARRQLAALAAARAAE